MDIFAQLRRDEDVKYKPYRDSVGKLTIGVGRNLDDVGIAPDECQLMLENDVNKVIVELRGQFPWFNSLNDARQGVMINMGFNMGIHGLLQFRNTLECIQAGQYDQAADEMMQSKWAEQVGSRAHRLSIQMRLGEWQ